MTSRTFSEPETSDPLLGRLRACLPQVLPEFVRHQRWFGGKADAVRSVEISEAIPLHGPNFAAYLFLIRVEYAAGPAQRYALPLMIQTSPEKEAPVKPGDHPPTALTVELAGTVCQLEDALQDAGFARFILQSIQQETVFPGASGRVTASSARPLHTLWEPAEGPLQTSVMQVEQSNTSVNYGDRLMLKFFRRVEEGVNLDLEIGRFLAERAQFRHTPPLAGAVEYQREGAPPVTLAILQGFVSNQGDAWRYTLQAMEEFLNRVRNRPASAFGDWAPAQSSLQLLSAGIPGWAQEIIGRYSRDVELLGRRTAELHRALASDLSDPDFAPEPFSTDYQRRLSESMIATAETSLRLLQDRFEFLPPAARERARRVLSLTERVLSPLRSFQTLHISALRTRLHGDYHLGQVLFTGSDWVIIDFEGEPERPLSERRIKRSPLRDVAGMLRSFHYAAMTTLGRSARETEGAAEVSGPLNTWVRGWRLWVAAIFLKSYFDASGDACFIPQNRDELRALLGIYLLEKAVYELAYELKNRPEWAPIPLEGILDLMPAD